MSIIQNPVFYNGYELESVTGLTVLATNPYVPARRRINISDIVRTDKNKATSAFYVQRPISVTVGISRKTRALVEQSLDTLMGMLNGVEKELVLKQGIEKRKYYATYSNSVMEVEGGSYLQLNLIFECSDSFGYDLDATPVAAITYTPTTAVNFEGSANFQAPIFTITYSAVSGGTTKNVIIGNQVTGQKITITRTWVAGDVLIVDLASRNGPTVRVNGVDVAFTGALPFFAPGAGVFTYEDSLSSRTMTGSILYTKRWV